MEFEVPLSASTLAIVEAANQRGIPTLRLGAGGLVQLGYGVRQQRIRGAETGQTSAVGESIARNAALTRRLLREAGIPAPDASAAVEQNALNNYRLLVVADRLLAAARRDLAVTGPEITDVTEQVHPEVAARVIDAVRVVGLDVAGIDLLAADIAQPLEVQGGAVVEVHACPEIDLHLRPTHGQPRPVAEAIVEAIFPAGETGRIPIVAVTGGGCHSTTSCLVAHVLQARGSSVALSRADGWFFAGRHEAGEGRDLPCQERMLLLNPLVESAIFETDPARIVRDGLAFDRCDVAIVTDAALAEPSHSLDELRAAHRRLLQAVGPTGVAVVNAHERRLTDLAEQCPGDVIYFSRGDRSRIPAAGRLGAARLVFLRHDCVFAAEGPHETRVAKLEDFSFAYGGLIASHLESVLAAVAGCWALGISWEAIRSCLARLAAELDPFSNLDGAWRGPLLPEPTTEPRGLVGAQ